MKKLTFVLVSALTVLSFGCKKKGGATSGAALAKMTEFKTEMCKCADAKCAQEVSDRMTKWNQDPSKDQSAKLSEQDQKKYGEVSEELGKCMQKAIGAATPVPATGSDVPPTGSADPAAAATGTGGLPKECDDYKATVEKLKSCAALPQKSKDALVKAYQDASAGWVNMPDAAKAALNTSCKAGTEAVVSAAKEACGW